MGLAMGARASPIDRIAERTRHAAGGASCLAARLLTVTAPVDRADASRATTQCIDRFTSPRPFAFDALLDTACAWGALSDNINTTSADGQGGTETISHRSIVNTVNHDSPGDCRPQVPRAIVVRGITLPDQNEERLLSWRGTP